MALIKPKEVIEYISKKIRIPRDLSEDIDHYCQWAGIIDVDYFFAESAKQILRRDKEYKKQTQCAKA